MTKHYRFTGLLAATVAVNGAFAAVPSVPNKLLVTFDGTVDRPAALATLGRAVQFGDARLLGHTQLQALKTHNWATLRFASGLSPLAAARILRKQPGIAWAQPDYLLFIGGGQRPDAVRAIDPLAALRFGVARVFDDVAVPDPAIPAEPRLPDQPVADPEFAKLWGLTRIEADKVWETQAGSRKIVVADIDTGIDYTHEDLRNNLWINPNPTMNDVVGYDFVDNDPLPFDDQSHGTHTAGTIGATGFNGVGVVGVSPQAAIMGLKFISKEGSGTTEDAVEAIDYAIAHGARIINASWGGPADESEESRVLIEAVARAEAANVLFVAAAGNDGVDNDQTPFYPAAIKAPNVLTVASTNDRDSRSFFSNYGLTTVHVAAPGSNVYSTLPGNKYGQYSGTSMACPHVAGLAALILAERPELTPVQVKEIIMRTVDPIATLQGKIVTGGRINARSALSEARRFGLR